jgi:hypothetical protein
LDCCAESLKLNVCIYLVTAGAQLQELLKPQLLLPVQAAVAVEVVDMSIWGNSSQKVDAAGNEVNPDPEVEHHFTITMLSQTIEYSSQIDSEDVQLFETDRYDGISNKKW